MKAAFIDRVRTMSRLGMGNILGVAAYRIGLKTGLHPVCRIAGDVPEGPFFRAASSRSSLPAVDEWSSSGLLFSHMRIPLCDAPPDWHANPLTGVKAAGYDLPWWRISDFDPAVGDIKLIWELSRMDWVPALAERAATGQGEALERLNGWLADWNTRNPPYLGPNWKCGQEASIRVMHLAVAAMMLGQVRDPEPGVREMLRVHLRRIAPTVGYAMAQDNNHGTSEAAALFIGGSWLAALGEGEGGGWARLGRRLLENRVRRLVGREGSFSQHSLNYHRLMLDTLSLAETWRRLLGLPEFSSGCQRRALAASEWLRHMLDPLSGEAPNVGNNDGARLLQLDRSPYRDFRPSVQLATALFAGKRAYAPEGIWTHALRWLGVPLPDEDAGPAGDYIADDGGFAVFRRGPAMVLMRYPRFRFRPGQADALHVDFWLNGRNVLRDGGSYSYNAGDEWIEYFGGVAAHNTVQFDGRDQMPRLGRFLYGSWLRTESLEGPEEDGGAVRFGAGYRDGRGDRHVRRIAVSDTSLQVTDELSGFRRSAVLRWRLCPGSWRIERHGDMVRVHYAATGGMTLSVQAGMPLIRAELVDGWESFHYFEKTALPVLEVEFASPGTCVSSLCWPL